MIRAYGEQDKVDSKNSPWYDRAVKKHKNLAVYMMKLNFNESNGNYEIIHNGFSWVSDSRKAYITVQPKASV